MNRAAGIQDLFAYNRWANERVLDAAAALSQDQYTQRVESSFSSVRETLAHMASAEWMWLTRAQGTSPREWPTHLQGETLDELRSAWGEVTSAQMRFADDLTDARLEDLVAYTTMAGQPF